MEYGVRGRKHGKWTPSTIHPGRRSVRRAAVLREAYERSEQDASPDSGEVMTVARGESRSAEEHTI